MMNDLICSTCGVTFPFYKNKGRPIPKFCSHKCRGHTGFKPGGEFRISEATEEEKMKRLKKSFEKNVIRQEGCWGWNGSKSRGGYGVMTCKRAIGSDRAHRASWIIHKGKIPDGMHVCHTCDNPICTNPGHLWLGTHRQNNDDKIAKGREAKTIPPRKIGVENSGAKLSDEQVKEIKFLLEKGLTSRDIGKQYGVSKTTILRIKNKTHWKHIGET